MCDQITKLAEQGKFYWIGVCVHGAGHICWGNTHLSISEKALNELMNQALTNSLPTEQRGELVIVWLGNTAIKLTAKGFQNFVALFQEGARRSFSKVTQCGLPSETEGMLIH